MKAMIFGLLAFLPLLVGAQESTEEKPSPKGDQKVFGKSEEASYEGQVVVIEVGEQDLVNEQSFKFIRRTLRRADDEGAKAVVFDIHTPGGYAWQTSDLMMVDLANLQVPSYAFVNSKAMSAGALIAVATDGIYMKPVAAIGSAGLVSGDGSTVDEVMRAKIESAYDAFVRSVVKEKGHNLDVVRAMMFADQEYEFGEIRVPEGSLLTLTSAEAVGDYEGEPLLARGIVDSVEELLKAEDLEGVPVVLAEPTGFEKLAWWVKYLSPVLILIGLGAAYAEMKAPGFGIGGAISLCAFGLFFFGNYAAGNMAGYELAAIFALGMLLIAAEVFLIPGTGIAGITGLLLVLGALFMAMIDSIDLQDFGSEALSGPSLMELIAWPAMSLGLGLIGGVLLAIFMMRYLPDTPFFGWLTLQQELVAGAGMEDHPKGDDHRVGWTGSALTDLRPGGKAEIQGETLDVVAEGGKFVGRGSPVRVVREDGMGVVVKEIPGGMGGVGEEA